MIKLYFLIVSVIIEFFTILFQLIWINPPQAIEVAELGQKTTEALFERGVLGVTSIIFLGCAVAMNYTFIKMVKLHRKEIIEQSSQHEANIKEIIKSHRDDSKEVALVFSSSIDKSHDIIMKHAQNEAIQTELMRGIERELIAHRKRG